MGRAVRGCRGARGPPRAGVLARCCGAVAALEGTTLSPRADAAAWAIIDVLPAYPLITAPVAAAATGRAKAAVYQALEQLQAAGVLTPASAARRNQVWEAAGLVELLAGLESGAAL